MKIHYGLEPISEDGIALTIGTFDGIHRGHIALLAELRKRGHISICVTFANHPSTVLRPGSPTPLLCTTPHKERLLTACNLDHLVVVPFDQDLAAQSAQEFLHRLHAQIPFAHLVLGHDARMGNKRAGDPRHIQHATSKLGTSLKYLPPVTLHGEPVSSSRIRSAITCGDLALAADLLGRTISFYSRVRPGAGKGRRIGTPTANLDIAGMCTPPFGVYAITVVHDGVTYPGVANLGVAPTLQTDRAPLLEAHLFDTFVDLYNHQVEVVLHAFLRPEKQFKTALALRNQIQADIAQARIFLKISV